MSQRCSIIEKRLQCTAAGEQYSPSARQLPSLDAFSGQVTYASRHQGSDCILGDETRVVHKVRLPPSLRYLALSAEHFACMRDLNADGSCGIWRLSSQP